MYVGFAIRFVTRVAWLFSQRPATPHQDLRTGHHFWEFLGGMRTIDNLNCTSSWQRCRMQVSRHGTRDGALCFGQEFRRVQPAYARRLVVSGQSNVARHHVRSRFEIPVDGTQSEAIAADLFDRHLGEAVAVDFTAPAYRKVD